MKVGLGTVQFGLNYGISNRVGQTPFDEAKRILQFAADHGIRVLDTAAAYGNSEQVIGAVTSGAGPFRIVTKTRPGVSDAETLTRDFLASLHSLRSEQAYGLVVHHAADLLGAHGHTLFAQMMRLKDAGRVQKIGASVYSGAEIDEIANRFSIDLIQLPYSIFDQRLKQSGHLQRLKDRGIEVHARSIFLQGVLLMGPDALPARLEGLKEPLLRLVATAMRQGSTALSVALRFVVQTPEVDSAICGVNTLDQLKEIISAAEAGDAVGPFDELAVADEALLNPATWN